MQGKVEQAGEEEAGDDDEEDDEAHAKAGRVVGEVNRAGVEDGAVEGEGVVAIRGEREGRHGERSKLAAGSGLGSLARSKPMYRRSGPFQRHLYPHVPPRKTDHVSSGGREVASCAGSRGAGVDREDAYRGRSLSTRST